MVTAAGRHVFASELANFAVGNSSISASRRSAERAIAQLRDGGERRLIEIAVRAGRERIALLPQEPADIAAVLEQKADRLVLGMALEEHEQAVLLPHERIHSRFR